MLAPGAEAGDCVALRIVGICRGDDLADAVAAEWGASLEGLGVADAIAHAAAHVGIHRHEAVTDQDLPRFEGGEVGADNCEIVGHRQPYGPALEVYLASLHGCLSAVWWYALWQLKE